MKKCPRCGQENSEAYAFCIKCGADLSVVSNPSANPSSIPNSTQSIRNSSNTKFKLLEENLTPADNELEVRSYHCTSFKSALLSLNAEGYLVVSNKRVVFHAFGSSFAGKSILQSEVPIEDVSGISIYKGSYFSFTHLLGAILFSGFIGSVVNSILIAIMASFVNSAIENQSLTNLDTIESTVNSLQTTLQVLLWILAFAALVGSSFFSRENIFRSALATTSALAFTELGGASYVASVIQNFGNSEQASGSSGFILILGMVVGIYALVCFFWFARRPTMSLAVGSKGGSSTPIAISGISSFGIYNTAASKALSAEPAEDAESLVKELGALIMDIQASGDLGIKQWRKE